MGLNKREIAVIAETNRDNYSIEIAAMDSGLWKASLKILHPEKHYDVFTSRGELKIWRDLGDAITYVQQTCPDCKEVKVNTGTWQFCRVV